MAYRFSCVIRTHRFNRESVREGLGHRFGDYGEAGYDPVGEASPGLSRPGKLDL